MPIGLPNPIRLLAAAALVALAGCADPEYDLSTPEKALDSAAKMVEDGRADLLPRLIDLKPRDLEFDDGVTDSFEAIRKCGFDPRRWPSLVAVV